MDRKSHWDAVYRRTGPDQVSWFQPEARLSRAMIEHVAPDRGAAILDVGAGASTLVDGLLSSGYRRVTVLDLSAAALIQAQQRLGTAAASVTWVEADVLTARLPADAIDVWHDRAVFHFLTLAADREQYIAQVRHTVRPGGYVMVATFAEDGPARCSGLDVARYSPGTLQGAFGPEFTTIESRRDEHRMPNGVIQAFTYCLCRYDLRNGRHAAEASGSPS